MAHTHSVFDTDQYFSIDENTRAITYEGDGIPVIAHGDRNSERFTFELPRYIDGHDMTKCNVAQVHFVNINTMDPSERISDIYNIDDLQVDPEDDKLALCTWLIGPNETKHVGSLNFALRFACVTGSIADYSWSTLPYTRVAIASTIDNTEDAASNLNAILDADNPVIELDGYYKGIVQIELEHATVKPSTSTQIVRAPSGKVLEYVAVDPVLEDDSVIVFNDRLSGTWSINTNKLFSVLGNSRYNNVTQKVNFSNGVPGSENDSYNCSSMTFDFVNALLKFDENIVFNNVDGWRNGDYGTLVTFDGIQIVGEEFCYLFKSVADYISGAASPPLIEDNRDFEVTDNNVTMIIGPSEGYNLMRKVTLNVDVTARPEALALQEKTVITNGTVTADAGYNGLSKVTVAIPIAEEASV